MKRSEHLPITNDASNGWDWNESLAEPRPSALRCRFFRWTLWSYLVIITAPVAIGVVVGAQNFPNSIKLGLVAVVWIGVYAVVLGFVVAPVVGFVLAVLITVTGSAYHRWPSTQARP